MIQNITINNYLEAVKLLKSKDLILQVRNSFFEIQTHYNAYVETFDTIEEVLAFCKAFGVFENLENFKSELSEFLKTNDKFRIYNFQLQPCPEGYNIVPIDPDLENEYNGEIDYFIDEICKKYKIYASIASWCYQK